MFVKYSNTCIMKKLPIVFLTLASIAYGQTLKTHVTDYSYIYADTTLNATGQCYFEAQIGIDTLVFDILPPNPPLVLVVVKRFASEQFMDGEILKMYAIDNDGIHCEIRLFISPTHREVHIIYSNAEFDYIFEN